MLELSELRVACVVPTYEGKVLVRRLMESLATQSLKFDVLVVDSDSKDGTAAIVRGYTRFLRTISPQVFNHGGTRQMMVDEYPDYDIYIFMTQDAYAVGSESLKHLLVPFKDDQVGAVYGRQLPHSDASIWGAHMRMFNYPDRGYVRSISDSSRYGMRTAFMSNSFAAYRRKALQASGGFPRHVILSEDMFVAAKMLLGGWKLAYQNDALCRHSHNYSVKDEFRRYFDIGVFHSRESWILTEFGGAGGEGFKYVRSELKFLGLRRLHLWPIAFWRNACKLLGYKLGQYERYLPLWLKRRFSMHTRFWDGPHARKN